MLTLRKYGDPPYTITLVHGGPGGGGEMAPIAEELSSRWGILEPIQTKKTISGQIEELKDTIENNTDSPIILIGASWGAWLSIFLAASHPHLVKKIILIGAGAFDDKYTKRFQSTRLSRLSDEERAEFQKIISVLADPMSEDKDHYLKRLGELATKTDNYDPIEGPKKPQEFPFRGDIYHGVWPEAVEWRRTGKLLTFVSRVQCPAIAIHGDFDPHPAEGVRQPLTRILKEFRFHLLEKCGHEPWKERYAKDKFFDILRTELKANE